MDGDTGGQGVKIREVEKRGKGRGRDGEGGGVDDGLGYFIMQGDRESGEEGGQGRMRVGKNAQWRDVETDGLTDKDNYRSLGCRRMFLSGGENTNITAGILQRGIFTVM